MTIRRLRLIAFLGSLLLVAASVAVTFAALSEQHDDALVINLAGRQRMLVQRMALETLGVQIGADPAYRQALHTTAHDYFEKTLEALIAGGEAPYTDGATATLPPAPNPEILAQLETVRATWREMHPAIMSVLEEDPQSAAFGEAAAAVERLTPAILSQTDQAVRLYEAEAARKVARVQAIQIGFLGMAAALLAVAFIFTERWVLNPIARLGAAAQRIGEGDLDTPVSAAVLGEIGRLARSLDKMRENLSAHILDSILDAVVVANPDGTVRMMNRAARELLGYTAAEVAGQPVGRFFAEEEEEEEEEVTFFRGTGLAQLVREGAAREVETTLVTRAGERVPVVFNGSVVRGAGEGRPLESPLLAVVGVARDMRPTRRLIQQAEARAAESTVLKTIAEELNRRTEIEPLMDEVLPLLSKTLGASAAWVTLLDERGNFTLAGAHNLPPALEADSRAMMRWPGCTCQRKLLAGELTAAANILQCERLLLVRGLPGESGDTRGQRYHAAVPIRVEGRALGSLNLAVSGDRVFTDDELRLLGAVGDQFGVAVERARLFALRQHSLQRLAALYAVGKVIAARLELEKVCQAIVDEVAGTLRYGAAAVLLVDREAGELFEVAWHGAALQRQDSRLKLGEGLVSRAVLSGQAQITSDVTLEPAYVPGLPGCRSEADIPIKLGDVVTGVLVVEDARENAYSQEDASLLTAIADQAAIAIENARLYEQVKAHHIEEQATLLRLSQALLGETEAQAMMDVVVRIAAEALKVEFAAIALVDSDGQSFSGRAAVGWTAEALQQTQRVPLSASTGLAYALRAHVPVLIPDEAHETRFGAPPWMADTGIVSSLVVPMFAADEAIGGLVVNSRTPRDWSDDEVRLLSLLASDMAQALERAQQYAHARERLERITALHEIDVAITSRLDLGERLDILLQKVAERLRVVAAAVAFVNPETQELVYAARHGLDGDFFQDGLLRVNEGIAGQVAHSGQLAAIQDVALEPRFVRRAIAGRLGIASYLAVPLLVHGEVIGILELATRERHTFPPEEIDFFVTLAGQAAVAIENARLFEETNRRAARHHALAQTAGDILATLDESALWSAVSGAVGQTLAADRAAIYLYDPAADRLACPYASGLSAEYVAEVNRRFHDLPGGRLLGDLRPMIVADVQTDPATAPFRDLMSREGFRCYAVFALAAPGAPLGALVAYRDALVPFTPDDIATGQTLTHIVAVALQNARLFEAERAQLLLARTLQEVGALLTSQLGLDEALERILDLLSRVVQYDSISIQLIDEDGYLHLAAGRGFPDLEQARRAARDLTDHSMSRKWAAERKAIVIADTHADDRWAAAPGVEYIRSWIGAPLLVKDRLIGTLNVDSCTVNAFDASMGQTVLAFANQAAIAIENARRYEETRQRAAELAVLAGASQAIHHGGDLAGVLDIVLRQACDLVGVPNGSILLLDESRERLRVAVQRGLDPRTVAEWNLEGIPRAFGTFGVVLETGEMVEAADARHDPRVASGYGPIPESLTDVPLRAEGQIIGILIVEGVPHEDGTRRVLRTLAEMAGVAIERARLFATEHEQRQLAESLREVGNALTATLDFDAVLDRLLELIAGVVPYDSANVMLVAERDGRVHVARMRGYEQFGEPVARDMAALSFEVAGTDNLRWMAETRQPLVIPDTAADPGWVKVEASAHVRSWVGAPLVVRDQVVAFFSLDKIEPNFYGPGHGQRLAAFAAQAALALQNAQLFESLAGEKRRLELLYNLSQNLAAILDPRDVAVQALDLTTSALGVFKGEVLMCEPGSDRLRLVAVSGYETESIEAFDRWLDLQIGQGLAGYAALTRAPVIAPDVARDEHWMSKPGVDEGVRSAVAIPLVAGDQLAGVLNLLSDRDGFFHAPDLPLLTAVAAPIALALQKAQLFEAERVAREQAEMLREVARAVSSSLELDEVLRQILAELKRVLDYSTASVLLLGETGQPAIVTGSGYADEQHTSDSAGELLQNSPILNQMARDLQPVIIPDVREHPGWLWVPGAEHVRAFLAVPILSQDRMIGALMIDSIRPGFFAEADAHMTQTLAQHMAAAIENARLFEAERDHAHRLDAIGEVVRQAASLDLDQLLHGTVDLVQQTFGYYCANVLLADPPAGEIVLRASASAAGHRLYEGYRLKIGEQGITGWVAASGQPLLVSDVEREPRYHFAQELAEARSELAVPILSAGQVVGVLDVQSDRRAAFTAADRDMLQTLAAYLAVAIANAQSFEEATLRFNDMRVLREIGVLISASLDLHATLVAILDCVVAQLAADAADILLLQSEAGLLEHAAGRGFRTEALQHTRLPLGEGYAGRAASERKVVHIPDLRVSAGDLPRAPLLTEEGFVTYYGVPLVSQGQITGVLELFHRSPFMIGPERLEFLQALGTQAAIAIENATLFDNLQRSHQAVRDAQTRLVSAARLTAVGELAAGVAHQINNPLTTVIADAQLLLKSVGSDHPGYASAAAIFQAGWRAQRVVQRLLNFSRPDEGKYVPTDVNETLVEALDLVGAHIGRGGADVKIQLATGLPLIPANGHQLEEVWINLLMNARDALVEGRPGVITLSSRLAADGAAVEVEVADNGRGLGEADRHRLFTPFYTTKEQGRGNGLGLSVCQSIVQDHFGQIRFESQAGEGTAFFIRLPLKRETT